MRSVTALIAATLLLAACSNDHTMQPPAAPAAPEPVATTHTTSQVVTHTQPAGSSLVVSKEIIDACKIDFGNVDTAPKFDFDESLIRPDERDVLQQIARCVTTGPLAGRKLELVGRADPRGEEEYNMALGARRASSVRDYLAQLGVASTNLATTSRGKLDATGTDEAGWQRDRRVDIDLQ